MYIFKCIHFVFKKKQERSSSYFLYLKRDDINIQKDTGGPTWSLFCKLFVKGKFLKDKYVKKLWFLHAFNKIELPDYDICRKYKRKPFFSENNLIYVMLQLFSWKRFLQCAPFNEHFLSIPEYTGSRGNHCRQKIQL